MALFDINGNVVATNGGNGGISLEVVDASAINTNMPTLPAGNMIPVSNAVLTNADQAEGYKFTCYKWEFSSSDLGAGQTYRIYAPLVAYACSNTNSVVTGLVQADGPYLEFTVPDNVAYYKYTVICIPAWCDITQCYMLPADSWETVDFSVVYPKWLTPPIGHKPRNLWNKYVNNASVGSISSTTGGVGSNTATTSFATKDLIPVTPKKHYTLSMGEEVSGGLAVIALFDSNKTFLYTLRLASGQYNTIKAVAGCIRFCINDENAAYMRCVISANADNYYLVEGDYTSADEIGDFDGDTFVNPISAPNQINNEPLARFKGKTLLALGDSITESNKGNEYTPWCSKLSRWFGMNLTNGGISGSGLAKYGSNNGSSLFDRLTARAEGDIFAEGTAYDYIILHGFMNDGSSQRDGQSFSYNGTTYHALPVGAPDDPEGANTVYAVAKACLRMLTEYYPEARIGFACSTPRGQVSSALRDDPESVDVEACHGHGWFERYIEAYRYACEQYGVPFLDLYHNSPFRVTNEASCQKYFSVNYEWDVTNYGGVVHPNALGQEEGIAMPIFQWMKTYL